MITNLSREEFPPSVLAELYRMRWCIETSFRDLKYSIGITNLHARREDYVMQEIAAKFVMFNFCQRIAREADVKDNPKQKNRKKVNVTVAIDIARDFFREIKSKASDILERISSYIEAYRPGIGKRKV